MFSNKQYIQSLQQASETRLPITVPSAMHMCACTPILPSVHHGN